MATSNIRYPFMRQTKMVLFLLIFLVFRVSLGNCHTLNDTNRLLKEKLADYNKSTRPTFNQSEPTVVSFSLDVVYFQEFDEVQQKVTFISVPTISWIDEQMQWNPADYGGLASLITTSGPFWIPNIVLTNSVGDIKPIGNDWQMIRYFSNGQAYFSPSTAYSSACGVDVTYYPYDRHTCELSFTPQGYGESEVYISVENNKVGTTYYIENGGWYFKDSNIQTIHTTYYSEMIILLTLERKPLYVIVNVILPIIFLAYLSNVVFVIPADCGERISYSITVLLAIAVYLTIVGDNLPKTSRPMAYFSYYLLAMLVTSILVTMATIFSLRIYHNDESEPVTGVWAKLAACFKCRKGNKQKKYVNYTDADHRQVRQNGIVNANNNPYVVVRDAYMPNVHTARLQVRNGRNLDILDRREMTSSTDKINNVEQFSWKDVSVAIDKIFFVFFIIFLTVATVVFVAIIASERKNDNL